MTTVFPPSWILTPSARLEIFTTQILPAELQPYLPSPSTTEATTTTNSPRRRRPLAILIVGQTGAGKTRLAPLLLRAMTASHPFHHPPAHFIADTYKTYHPHYASCLSQYPPAQASVLAGLDARLWLQMACQHASAHEIDVLVESACRHPDDFCKLADIFHGRGGYVTKVAILAVPEGVSRLGCLVRYYKKLPEAGSRGLPVRLTPRRVHDESYGGLREAARWVDGDGQDAVDGVVVVRRGNLVAYGNERVELDGQRKWVREPGALKTLEIERARKLSEEERRIVEEDLEVLRKLGDPKVDEEIEAIQTLVDGIGVGFSETFPELEPLDADEFVRT
ncbi:zeta toxin-domain-containing protein [Pseudoneurospora amorphoporcata]|uniref:Zeta toxin-domain-containing protein n=1 Tax=Pseudoneurospora amorphoporcata TaxID=241081 RepID=A0AAN6SI04_9PEZI|nr:zeta toxin-domain-containing protein [Pseudoneurospora amorphoporcata]